jgi:hypothetical protein
MDRAKYHTNRLIGQSRIVIPTKKKEYVLFMKPPIDYPYVIVADENRHFLKVKTILLEKLTVWVQQLVDRLDGKPQYLHVKDYLVQHICTFMEFLAN